MKRRFIKERIPIIILGVLAIIALLSFIVMSLWNIILSPVLHIGVINFWQALGILVLSKILFGGFHRRHWGSDRRHAWQQKFATMTPEEREKFKSEWRNRCNRWSGKDQSTAASSATTQP